MKTSERWRGEGKNSDVLIILRGNIAALFSKARMDLKFEI
jgi:hypothetical protein